MSGVDKDTQAFTVRLPLREHHALNVLSQYKGKSMAELVREAIRALLLAEAADERIDRWALETGTMFQETIKRLAEDT